MGLRGVKTTEVAQEKEEFNFCLFFAQIRSFSFKKWKELLIKIDRSVFDSHEDFGDKLGLGGVKTTKVAPCKEKE